MKIISLLAIVIFITSTAVAGPRREGMSCEVREAAQEVKLLNLVNNLYLTQQQTEFVLAKAKEAQQIREKFRDEAKVREDEYLGVLSEIKHDLKEDNFISEEKRKEFHLLKKQIEDLRYKYEDEVIQLAKEIEGNLTSVQKGIVEEYKPCIIPPKGPARAGQATDNTALQRHLARIREIPEDRYQVRKYHLAEKAVERKKRHLPSGCQFDEEAEIKKVLGFYDKVRSLDDLEFVLQEKSLAEELKGFMPEPPVKLDLAGKIKRHLLNPAIISILEEKLMI